METVQSTFNTLEFISQKKAITTKVNVEHDHEHLFTEIYGDQNRFQQIFINFISNALKFTSEKGQVEVKFTSQRLTKAS